MRSALERLLRSDDSDTVGSARSDSDSAGVSPGRSSEALAALVSAVAPASPVARALDAAQEALEGDPAALASGARGSLATAYALLKSLRRRVDTAAEQAARPAAADGPSAIADSEDELVLLAGEAAKVADYAAEAGRLAQAAAAAEPSSEAREEFLEQANQAALLMSEAARNHGLLRAAFQTLSALEGLTEGATDIPAKLPQAEAVEQKDGSLAFTVPEDAKPGEMISIETPQGTHALMQLSPDASPGDTIDLPYPSELTRLGEDDKATLEQIVTKADFGLRLAGLPAPARAAAEEALRAAGLRTQDQLPVDGASQEGLLAALATALRDAGSAEDVVRADIAALRAKLQAPPAAEPAEIPSTLPTEALSAATLTAAETARVRSVLEDVEDVVRNAGILEQNIPPAFRDALRDAGVQSDMARVENFAESFTDEGLEIAEEAQEEIRETLEGAGVQLEEEAMAAVGKALLVDLAFGPGTRAGNSAAQVVAKHLPPGRAIRIVSKTEVDEE